MTPEAAKALEASIKHWEENAVAETPRDADTRADAARLNFQFYARKEVEFLKSLREPQP